ncbi:uncharacterized protein LOC111435316 [Cucurbita moschata]|uniref:U5 small nuclear ribonucleoprotein TSSC4 n=1 Tax=Cucurbita moschata TaxID=3662 RepID=A0A6J1EKJ9_CUCMO|nr:uncharacterized protein LOC111435316 [Cucurbita moschata]
MEDNFKVRVDRIFGSLSSSSSSSSSYSTAAFNSPLSSLWCLTDDEVERREWIKGKVDQPEPELEPTSFLAGERKVSGRNSFRFRDDFEDDVGDLDENPESNGSSSNFPKPDDYGDEEWEIKSLIGRDCTLDFEEEEDEYDKVAVGKEKVGDRLYMKDITDCGVEIDSCTELPTSIQNFTRDPRANHLAAKVRLKEDAEASKTMDSLHVSENGAVAIAVSECNASQNPKSILKRKDNHLDAKSHKRVRFDPECEISRESQGSEDISMEANSSIGAAEVTNEATFHSQGFRPQAPDYLRNPSRYTHYTFDSSNEVDEESNKNAYMDFLQLVRGSKTIEPLHLDDTSTGPPKSITFIPKKKAGDTVMLENPTPGEQNHQNGVGKELHQKGMPIGIASVDAQTDDVCSMEEDEPEKLETRRNSSQKTARQYRMRAKMDSEEA